MEVKKEAPRVDVGMNADGENGSKGERHVRCAIVLSTLNTAKSVGSGRANLACVPKCNDAQTTHRARRVGNRRGDAHCRRYRRHGYIV